MVDTSPQTAKTLTTERRETHGVWLEQATLADNLMFQVTHSKNWDVMGPSSRQALFNIMQKVSRLCTGDHREPDHFKDIEGYAFLGAEEVAALNKQEEQPGPAKQIKIATGMPQW